MLMDHATATSEINQLLGDSSDDDDEVNVPLDDNQELSAGEVDELPEGHNSNKDELHDLLGDSDDDGDGATITRDSYDSTSGKILIDEQPLIATIRSVNDLDDILGARDADEVTKSPTKDTKDRSMSKMVLPYTYKSKAGDSSIFVRTPNFIKIQSAEYSRLSYNPDQERQFFDGATAVIRWRLKRDADGEVVCDADGIPVKESNARMVEWSDGSMQLVVGDAVFQCKGLSLDNCYSYAQQKASMLSSSETDQTPVAVSDCLECVGTISQRYMLQPSSLDSEIHARMSMKISERSKKDRRTRDRDYEDITEKPEITLAALARKEEEEMRRERRAKEVNEYRSGGASQLYGRRPSMSAEYLAGRDDDEFDGDNLAALKKTDYDKKPKPSSAQKRRYYEEEEVEDDEEEEEEQERIGNGFEEEDEVTGSGRSWEQSSSKKAKSRDDASTVLASTEKASKVKKPLKGSDEAVLNSTVDKGSDDDNDLMVQRKRLSRAIIDSDDD